MTPFEITTDRLTLRPPHVQDAAAINSICQDPHIQEWTLVPSPYSLADAHDFITLTQHWWTQDQPTWLVVVREVSQVGAAQGTGAEVAAPTSGPSPDHVAGIISYNNPLAAGDRGEVGFWANPDHRGRGYITEALGAIIDFGFEFGLGAIGWRCEVHDGQPNFASARVAQKCGFVFDGCVRLEHSNKGTLYDSWIATLTPEDPRVDTGPWA